MHHAARGGAAQCIRVLVAHGAGTIQLVPTFVVLARSLSGLLLLLQTSTCARRHQATARCTWRRPTDSWPRFKRSSSAGPTSTKPTPPAGLLSTRQVFWRRVCRWSCRADRAFNHSGRCEWAPGLRLGAHLHGSSGGRAHRSGLATSLCRHQQRFDTDFWLGALLTLWVGH